MIEGINDVKEFLRNTQEIVVWEINEFEQVWDADAHAELKDLLITEFADWLVTPGEKGWKTSLSDIWDRADLTEGQGRLIITYNCQYTDPQFFFPEVKAHKLEDHLSFINFQKIFYILLKGNFNFSSIHILYCGIFGS